MTRANYTYLSKVRVFEFTPLPKLAFILSPLNSNYYQWCYFLVKLIP